MAAAHGFAVTGLDLSGYMVKDAARAIAFYRDVLGLEDDEREGLRRAGITTPASSASGTTVQADISAGA